MCWVHTLRAKQTKNWKPSICQQRATKPLISVSADKGKWDSGESGQRGYWWLWESVPGSNRTGNQPIKLRQSMFDLLLMKLVCYLFGVSILSNEGKRKRLVCRNLHPSCESRKPHDVTTTFDYPPYALQIIQLPYHNRHCVQQLMLSLSSPGYDRQRLDVDWNRRCHDIDFRWLSELATSHAGYGRYQAQTRWRSSVPKTAKDLERERCSLVSRPHSFSSGAGG